MVLLVHFKIMAYRYFSSSCPHLLSDIIRIQLFCLQVLTEGRNFNYHVQCAAVFIPFNTLLLLDLFGSSEIMDNLVKEGVLSKKGNDTYAIINKDRVSIFS